MNDKIALPPLKNLLKPLKNSSSDSSKNSLVKKTLILEEFHSRLKNLNGKFFDKIDELNKNLESMDGIDSLENPLPNEKSPNTRNLYNFTNERINASYAVFHNDMALAGAKYPKSLKPERFSRRKCRDLKEILRFSMKPKKSQMLNPFKYRDFIKKFEENEKENEKIEKLQEFKEMEKAHMEKMKENRKIFIKSLVQNTEKERIHEKNKKRNKLSGSISPEIKSPSKHSRKESSSSPKQMASPKKSSVMMASGKLFQSPRKSQPFLLKLEV